MAQPIEENVRILAIRVRDRAALPAFILVSSAQPDDGSTYVACGVARACAEAGLRTLLLDARTEGPGVAEELDDESVAGLTAASLGGGESGKRLEERDLTTVLQHVRARFDMTIVDASPIPTSSMAVRLARAADGVLLAVRLGRRPSDADAETIALVGHGSAPLIGIVPTRLRRRRDDLRSDPLPTLERIPHIVPPRAAVRW